MAVSPTESYPAFAGFLHLAAGLACGTTGLAAGYAIGYVGDAVSIEARLARKSLTPVRSCIPPRIQDLRRNGLDPHFRVS